MFKASRAIEYSDVVLIGMQPQGDASKDFNAQSGKRLPEAHRRGPIWDPLQIEHNPIFNIFEDNGDGVSWINVHG